MKINKPQHVWQLAFDFEWPTSIAFLGSNRRVAAGNRAGQILVWDLPESPPKPTDKKKYPPSVPPAFSFAGHTNAVTQLRATADGKTLISTSLDRTVRMWSPSTPPTSKVNVVLDQSVRVRNARRKKPAEQENIMNAPGLILNAVSATQTLKSHQDWVKALSLSNDGKRILTGDDACISIVHDLASLKEVSRWKGYSRVWVTAAALSPDGKTAFTAEFAGSRSSFDRPAAQARLWDAETGKMKLDLLKLWTPKIKDKDRTDSYGYARAWSKLMKRGFVCAEFSPDGKILAAGQGGETDTGKIHLIDVASGKILRTVSGHRYGACDVTFSADGKYVLSSGRDTAVRICQVSDGKGIAVLGKSRGGQFKDWLHAIAISPDQQWVAAADIAGLVHLWKLAT